MNNLLHTDAIKIINYAIENVLPNKAVEKALANFTSPKGNIYMISIGKAAYSMAKETLKHISIYKGLVITKYSHSKNDLKNTEVIEAGHPILDENSILAAHKAINLVSNLTQDDTVIFLISGGGSSLFEAPLIPLDELQDINNQLLKSGATIQEINTIRKRLSKVKGGKFAKLCEPAQVFNIVLSDIINDPLDMIASGPTAIDTTTATQTLNIVHKYNLKISDITLSLLNTDGIKDLNNIQTYITGNNEDYKLAAKNIAKQLGYNVTYIEEPLISDTNQAEHLLSEYMKDLKPSSVVIAGGEIVLQVKGKGLGGRNQELALRLSKYLKDHNTAIICVGSDGTDGPTDAAGGYMDLDLVNDEIDCYLNNNDSYNYLKQHNGLIVTGPTGTNVNDLYMIIKR